MTRVKGGPTTRRKHKKLLNLASGFRMTRHKLFRVANEAVLHAGEYAFHGRKLKKRQFRRLWITRLGITLKDLGVKYSTFIQKLKVHNVELDRKMLAKLATEQPETFKNLVEQISA